MFAFSRRLAFSLALLVALMGLGACAILPLDDSLDYQDSRDQEPAGRSGKHRPEGRHHRGRPEPAPAREESRSQPAPAAVQEDSRSRPEGKHRGRPGDRKEAREEARKPPRHAVEAADQGQVKEAVKSEADERGRQGSRKSKGRAGSAPE